MTRARLLSFPLRPCNAQRVFVLLLGLVLSASHSAQAQNNALATQLVWALDAPSQGTGTPVIRVYDPAGRQVLLVSNLPGSGAARAIGFDRAGRCYLARGDAVYQLSRSGVATGVVFTAPAGGSQAQDVIELPTGDMLASFGTTTANSRIGRYSTAGALLATITGAVLDHPRRLACRNDSTGTVYVANRNPKTILSFSTNAAIPLFTSIANLTTPDIGPIGLAYDDPNQRLWVVGDHGSTQAVGSVLLPSGAFTQAFLYPPPSAPNLASAAGCYFDRFRRLYIAGRNVNMGTAGAYVFSTDAGGTPAFITRFPVGGVNPPTSIIDVKLQPAVVLTCSPMIGTENALVYGSGTASAVNRITFSCPDYPNAIYVAALSFRFEQTCAPALVNGILPSSLIFPAPDTRGIPLRDDLIFRNSAALAAPTNTPPLGNLNLADIFGPGQGVRISGFIGTLDATGGAEAFIDLGTVPDGAIPDGLGLSIAWLVFDLNVSSGVGYVSQPQCLTIRLNVNPTFVCP